MAALETESATLNPWGGRDHRIVGGGMLRTTNEDGERSLIRLDQNGVHLYSVRFDPGTPDEVVADAFYLALRFDEPGPSGHGQSFMQRPRDIAELHELRQLIPTRFGSGGN